MRVNSILAALSLALAAAAGCGGSSTAGGKDAGPKDGAVADAAPGDAAAGDAGVDAGAAGPTVPFQSAGGGKAASTNFRLQFSVGAPQPMGTGAAGDKKVRVGPTAGAR